MRSSSIYLKRRYYTFIGSHRDLLTYQLYYTTLLRTDAWWLTDYLLIHNAVLLYVDYLSLNKLIFSHYLVFTLKTSLTAWRFVRQKLIGSWKFSLKRQKYMLQCVLHRRANSTVNGGINPDKDIYAIPSRYSFRV